MSDWMPAALEPPTVIFPQKAGKKVKILNEGASGSAMRNVTFVMVFDEGQNK